MRKLFFMTLFMFIGIQLLFASGAKEEIPEWGTVESMYENVGNQLGHEIEKHEKTIIDTTYLYYYNKCKGKWSRELWDVAVSKAVEICKNPIAIAAAKAGVFGEKLLQTLVVTAEDMVSGFNNWIESGAAEYQNRHK